MNYTRMGDIVDWDNDRRMQILTGKGKEYTDHVDALSNFKVNAERLGMHPAQVLSIYMFKHINSIETFLRQFSQIKDDSEVQDSAEGITSRIDDAVNYLELLHLLLIDLEIVKMANSEKV